MKRRIMAMLLSLALCLSLLPGVTLADEAVAAADGDATVIGSQEAFDALFADGGSREALAGNYTLKTNISVSTPIGNSTTPFTGTFDGDGHTITLNITGDDYQALFGYLNGGTVKNLTVAGSVSGRSYVAGVVAYNNGGRVENCHNKATIRSTDGNIVGGIVSYNSGGTVTECSNSGEINVTGVTAAGAYTGGIVGYATNGTVIISNCWNSGNINVKNGNTDQSKAASTGGIVGALEPSQNQSASVISCYNTGDITSTGPAAGGVIGYNIRSTISDCYNTGRITGYDNSNFNSRIGGIMGHNGTTSSTISRCYNIGTVTNTNTSGEVGAIVGYKNNTPAAVSNCYWETGTAGQAIGNDDSAGTSVESVTEERLASGEIAWLLRNNAEDKSVWGQRLSGDKRPMLIGVPGDANSNNSTAPVVSRVTFYDVGDTGYVTNTRTTKNPLYTNPGNISMPATSLTTGNNYSLAWYRNQNEHTAANEFKNPVTAGEADIDINLYPALRVKFGGKKIDLTGTYGSVTTLNLDTLMSYADGTNAAGNFTYEIVSGNADIGASISGTTLTIPATTPAKDSYTTLTIIATEKEHVTVLKAGTGTGESGVTYGLTDVTLTGKIKIDPKALTPSIDGTKTKVYDGTTDANKQGLTIKLADIEDGDDVSATASFAYTDPNAGSGKTIEATGIKLTGSDAGNYTLNDTTATATDGEITKLTVRFIVSEYSYVFEQGVKREATITPSTNLVDGKYSVVYKIGEDEEENPINVGDYDIWVTLTGENKDNFQFDTNSKYVRPSSITEDGSAAIVNVLHIAELPITKQNTTVEVSPGSKVYNGETQKPDRVKVTVQGELSSAELTGTDYDALSSATPINVGKYDYTVIGKGNYGGEVTFTEVYEITELSLNNAGVSFAPSSAIYNGKDQTPKAEVTVDGKTLTEGKDFTITWDKSIVDAGSYTATITAVEGGNYSGSKVVETKFTVDPAPLNGATVTLDSTSATYDGTDKAPKVSVKLGKLTLTEGKDYTITWSDDVVNARAYTATITAIEGGNYTDTTVSGTFTVKPASLSGATISPTSVTYNGSDWKDQITVTLNGKTLTPDTDYTITFDPSNVKEAGTYTVTITAKSDGNYTDTATATFEIKAKSTSGGGSSSSGTSSTPNIKEDTRHGSTSTSNPNPKKGDTVTIYPEASDGYDVGDVVVKDKDGNILELVDNGDGSYSFVQPEGGVTISVEYDCTKEEHCPIHPFEDTSTKAWYHDGIHYCVEDGLMVGYGDGNFHPDADLSRAMLAQILYNLEKNPDVVASGSIFTDVVSGAWYVDAVSWATRNNILLGYGGGLVGPEDAITREQLAVMLYRYAVGKGKGDMTMMDRLAGFADGDQVSDYAVIAMNWAVSAGIIVGKENRTLDSQGEATRAEAATMFMRYLKLGQ